MKKVKRILITLFIFLIVLNFGCISQKKFQVKFIIDEDNTYTEEVVSNSTVDIPSELHIYNITSWLLNGEIFNFDTPITEDITLYAEFPDEITINYNYGEFVFANKEELRKSFYHDFYNFLLSKEFNFPEIDIHNFDDFLSFCLNWNALGKSDLYGVGDAFSKYYVTIDVDGKVEEQPIDTFIGWCWQNGMYHSFIKHLIKFFAYWRTDEGYTNETNNGNDFFASPWASLVDTAKFFYFSKDTLETKYPWFKSERVRDALDNIPDVLNAPTLEVLKYKESLFIPEREGFVFIGWYKEKEYINNIDYPMNNMIVYAKWQEIS